MFFWISALLASFLSLSSPSLAPDSVAGTVLASGPVFLNGNKVNQVSLVTDGDRLETGAGGIAALSMSSTDRLIMGERSSISLKCSKDGVFANVERGRVQVNASHLRLSQVRISDQAVSISSAAGVPRSYMVTRLQGASYVLARQGSLTVTDEGYGNTTEVPEGMVGAVRTELAHLEVPPQSTQRPIPASSTSGRRAGLITALQPTGYILRGSSQLPAAKDAVVNWLDEVESKGSGRVRMSLDDGSILTLGSKSKLKIVQHDAQAQNTNLDLAFGRVRAQVVKLAKTNSNFEIRTSTAVCGVLGTDFFVETDGKKTRLVVFEGRVSFTPIAKGVVAAAATTVTVLAGQTSTATAGAAVAPVSSGASATSAAAASTTVSSQGASLGATVATTAATRVAVLAAAAVPAAATTAAVTSASTNPSSNDTAIVPSQSRP